MSGTGYEPENNIYWNNNLHHKPTRDEIKVKYVVLQAVRVRGSDKVYPEDIDAESLYLVKKPTTYLEIEIVKIEDRLLVLWNLKRRRCI